MSAGSSFCESHIRFNKERKKCHHQWPRYSQKVTAQKLLKYRCKNWPFKKVSKRLKVSYWNWQKARPLLLNFAENFFNKESVQNLHCVFRIQLLIFVNLKTNFKFRITGACQRQQNHLEKSSLGEKKKPQLFDWTFLFKWYRKFEVLGTEHVF